jgi:oligopeptide/dipeptide ABC transporter ATP-binding protein
MTAGDRPVLSIERLRTWFRLDEGMLKAVDGVDLAVKSGEVLGIIGESGSGKSVTAQSIMRIVPAPGRIVSGKVELFRNGGAVDLTKLGEDSLEMRSIRGNEISMIFQEPMTSLSPVHKIGDQIAEVILNHEEVSKQEALDRAVSLLKTVGMGNAEQRIDEYPHALSGGLRQRVVIAIALACRPSVLIADEPTTALDVTVQAQILDLLEELQRRLGMATIYITHALGVIYEVAHRVAVMYLGRIVETAPVKAIFSSPLHPYTQDLLQSIPQVGARTGERLKAIRGNVPIPIDMPPQCGFASRCSRAIPGKCFTAVPALVTRSDGHHVRCFLYGDETDESA